MTRKAAPRALLLLGLLATMVVVLNSTLRLGSSAPPSVPGIERELAGAVTLKLTTEDFTDPIEISCAPPPGMAPARVPTNLVCQVTAYDQLRPSKSPVWFEDVTCNLPVPAGTPNCGSSGGDALQ